MRVVARWGTHDARLADMLDGVLVVPVLLAALALDLFPGGGPGAAFEALPAARREEPARSCK